MVNESWPWKRDLEREARDVEARVERYAKGVRSWPSESLFYRVERVAFLFAFITRKLLDCNKLSHEIERAPVHVRRFSRRQRQRLLDGDAHPIMKQYTFSRHTRESLALRRLCDVLIHSQEFLIGCHTNRTFSLSFNSDRSEAVLYDMKLATLLKLAHDVAADDVTFLYRDRDPRTGKMRDLVRSRERPSDWPLHTT